MRKKNIIIKKDGEPSYDSLGFFDNKFHNIVDFNADNIPMIVKHVKHLNPERIIFKNIQNNFYTYHNLHLFVVVLLLFLLCHVLIYYLHLILDWYCQS